MKSILEEAKTTICKFQDNISKYYNRWHMSGLVFSFGNKIFLDNTDIYIIYQSQR